MPTKRTLTLASAICLVALTGVRAQDAEHGMGVFEDVCAQCHSLEPGMNRIGPSLAGVVGRKAGALDDFNYSQALEQSDVQWTPSNLAEFIEAPKDFIPGNRMPFTGLPDADQRQAVVAYLQREASGEAAQQ